MKTEDTEVLGRDQYAVYLAILNHGAIDMFLWRSAMRATQTAWNSLSHLEEATLHPGLFKRLRAVVVVCVAIAVMEVDL